MSYLGFIGEITETGRSGSSSFEWKIPGFLSLPGKNGDYYTSPYFEALDGVWCFRLYPNGLVYSDSVDIILCGGDLGRPKTLSVTLGIKGAEGEENRRGRTQEFSKDDRACYWDAFCLRSQLKEQESKLMTGHAMILTIDMRDFSPGVTVVEAKETEVPSGENQSLEKQDSSSRTDEAAKEAEVPFGENQSLEKQGVEELAESLKRLLNSGKDSDVVIKVQDKEFPAHRLILQARTPVFDAMFSHDMVEKQRGVVTMEGCNPESFPAFLEHVYTGSTGMISNANVFGLYAASEMYDLKCLKKACAEFLKKNLSVDSFCDAISLAVKYDEKELIELSTEFFCNNSLQICKTVDWQIFLKENTTVGNELLIKAFSK